MHLSFPSSLKTRPEHVDWGPLVSKDGIPWLFQLCTGAMTCSEDRSLQPWLSPQWIQCHLPMDFHWLWGVGVGNFSVYSLCDIWFFSPKAAANTQQLKTIFINATSQQTAVLWESHFPLVHCFPYPLARALFVLPGSCLVGNTFYWPFSGAF